MAEHPSIARAREIAGMARNQGLRDLVSYWLSVHPGECLPGRKHFDPLDVPQALPHLVLTDVERDPFRFRIRLMGTAVVSAFGRDFTGLYVDESMPGIDRSLAVQHRIEVVETGLPSYRYGTTSVPFRLDFAPLERVYLPLAADGERVDMILGMAVYLGQERGQESGPG